MLLFGYSFLARSRKKSLSYWEKRLLQSISLKYLSEQYDIAVQVNNNALNSLIIR